MERTREAAPTLRVARWSVPWAWVVFAFALGTGLLMGFVVFRVQSLVDQNIDPYFFGDMGKSIADGNGFEGFGSLITRRAPLYPIVIGGVYAVFGDHQKLIVLLHVLMFSGTCVVAYDMGRRLFNHRTGVIAGFVCALHPMLLRYIPNLHLETQLTLLITLTAWLTIRFYERPTVAAGALVGLASGAAALTKAVALLYPALFVAGIILASRAARRRGEQRPTPWKPILAIFVVMGCLILPWTARNYRSSGHFVLISSGTSDAFLRGFIFTETDYITLRRPPYTDAENASNAYFEALAEADDSTMVAAALLLEAFPHVKFLSGLRRRAAQVGHWRLHLLVPVDVAQELVARARAGTRRMVLRGDRVAPSAQRAAPGVVADAAGAVPQPGARPAAGARALLGAHPSRAHRDVGLRCRHAARQAGSSPCLTCVLPTRW